MSFFWSDIKSDTWSDKKNHIFFLVKSPRANLISEQFWRASGNITNANEIKDQIGNH